MRTRKIRISPMLQPIYLSIHAQRFEPLYCTGCPFSAMSIGPDIFSRTWPDPAEFHGWHQCGLEGGRLFLERE